MSSLTQFGKVKDMTDEKSALKREKPLVYRRKSDFSSVFQDRTSQVISVPAGLKGSRMVACVGVMFIGRLSINDCTFSSELTEFSYLFDLLETVCVCLLSSTSVREDERIARPV
jgi:hypothetical protein